MPSVSSRQHAAMEAAAHGVSKLGIPKKVGEEFLRADKGKTFDQASLAPNAAIATGIMRSTKNKPPAQDHIGSMLRSIGAGAGSIAQKIAAGTVFRGPDGTVLLLKRAGEEGKDNFVGHWALPGGGAEPGETADQCAQREAWEEMGGNDESMREQIGTGKRKVLSETDTPNGMRFTTFLQDVFQKFEPILNDEHTEWAWAKPDKLPSPLHPAVEKVLRAHLAEDDLSKLAAFDEWNESAHKRDSDGKFGSGGGGSSKEDGTVTVQKEEGHERSSSTKRYVGDPDREKEDRQLGIHGKKKPEDRSAHEGKKSISHEALTTKLKGMTTEKLKAASENKDVDPLIRAHVKRELTSRLMGGHDEQVIGDSVLGAIRMAKKPAARDMKPTDWSGLIRGLIKFFTEEEREPEHAEDDERGKLNEKEKVEADKDHGKREEQPADVFLEPGERKYPVKTKQDGGWKYSRDLLLAAAREARMHHHEDLAKRADAIRAREFAADEQVIGDSALVIAMDRDLEREKTRDGRLIVKRALITKANVCPYVGKEIPGWEKLGLDPDRVYNLLRDPEELKKGAETLNGVQLLKKHTPVSAQQPHQDKTVGSLGTDAEFDGENLYNSLFVNVQDSIDGIESGKQRELSAGYHYKADMTPGNFNGKAYDGVMRDIVFNHVALVEDGRVGPDASI